MNDSLGELKRKLRWALLAIAVLSFYIGGLVASLAQHGTLMINPMDLFAQIVKGSYPWAIALLIMIVVSAICVWEITKAWKESLFQDAIGRNFKYSKEIQPYGNAHFAKPQEYADQAQIREAKDCTGLILGQLSDDGTQCVDFNPQGMMNLFMVIFGTSGMGKSFGFVEPNLLQLAKQRRSVIVTDPSGELYTHLAAYFQMVGYKVRRFDLVTFDKTDGWDCLKFLCGLDENELSQKAQIFASSVVNNIGESGSIYAEGATALLKAIILYVILDKNTEKKTMKSVNAHLKAGSIQYYKTLFSDQAGPDMKMAIDAWSTVGNASENLLGNIITHLTVGLQTTQTPIVEEMLSTDDIDFEMCGREPTVIFCRFSATDSTYKFITALFFTMGFYTLINLAEKQGAERENGSLRLDTPVTFMLDEFPSIGIIPNYDTIISNVRKYGLSIIMIAQNYPQFRKNYPYSEQSILDACSTQICLGTNNADTADYFSKRMGMMSIETESKSEDKNGSQVGNTNKGVGKAELMSGAEIMAMRDTEILIDLIKKPVIYAYKFPKFLHPEFCKTRNMKNSEIPGFYEHERKAEARRIEKETIAAWNEAHANVEVKNEDKTEIKQGEKIDFTEMSPSQIFEMIIKDDIRQIKDHFAARKQLRADTKNAKVVNHSSSEVQNTIPVLNFALEDEELLSDEDEEVVVKPAVKPSAEVKKEPKEAKPAKGKQWIDTENIEDLDDITTEPKGEDTKTDSGFDDITDDLNDLLSAADDFTADIPDDLTDEFSISADIPDDFEELFGDSETEESRKEQPKKETKTDERKVTPKETGTVDKQTEPAKTKPTEEAKPKAADPAKPKPAESAAKLQPVQQKKETVRLANLPAGAVDICDTCGSPIDQKTVTYSKQNFGKPLCRRCQNVYRNEIRRSGTYNPMSAAFVNTIVERKESSSIPKK